MFDVKSTNGILHNHLLEKENGCIFLWKPPLASWRRRETFQQTPYSVSYSPLQSAHSFPTFQGKSQADTDSCLTLTHVWYVQVFLSCDMCDKCVQFCPFVIFIKCVAVMSVCVCVCLGTNIVLKLRLSQQTCLTALWSFRLLPCYIQINLPPNLSIP